MLYRREIRIISLHYIYVLDAPFLEEIVNKFYSLIPLIPPNFSYNLIIHSFYLKVVVKVYQAYVNTNLSISLTLINIVFPYFVSALQMLFKIS